MIVVDREGKISYACLYSLFNLFRYSVCLWQVSNREGPAVVGYIGVRV